MSTLAEISSKHKCTNQPISMVKASPVFMGREWTSCWSLSSQFLSCLLKVSVNCLEKSRWSPGWFRL